MLAVGVAVKYLLKSLRRGAAPLAWQLSQLDSQIWAAPRVAYFRGPVLLLRPVSHFAAARRAGADWGGTGVGCGYKWCGLFVVGSRLSQ
eukprot:SAG25_NODE_331_length_9668_cov_3.863518_5_plen_89_part_00